MDTSLAICERCARQPASEALIGMQTLKSGRQRIAFLDVCAQCAPLVRAEIASPAGRALCLQCS